MLVYYKFYYTSPTNWYITNEVIQYSFILLLKCHLIGTLVCKVFVVKFVISLAFSQKKKKIIEMKNAKVSTNFRKKIIDKLMWQDYGQCYLNNII